jgi:ketosteroid isomerase-like protein
MVVPKDELSLVVREWYYAASEGQVEQFLSFFLQDASATYFGTDPHELWYGFDQIKENIEENFRMYGKWTVMSKNLQVHRIGDSAVFTDEVELSARYGGSSIAEDARMSGVLVLKEGKWKIAQVHFSLGIPNRDLLPG